MTGNKKSFGWSFWTWAGLSLALGLILILIADRMEGSPHLSTLFHEVGFAIIVAVLIWLIFERLSHARTDAIWHSRIDQITEDVFYGVLRRRIPKALMKTANELILTRDFVRSFLTIEYELKSMLTDAQVHFVQLATTISYRLENIGDDDARFPVAISIPNPQVAALKKYVKVNRIIIQDSTGRDEVDLAGPMRNFETDLENSREPQVTLHCKTISLKSEETVELTFDYVMAKEEEDDEIFQTIFAADSITLRITDRDGPFRVIGARSLHPRKLECLRYSPETGHYHYHLPHYLLPYQGVVFWWKRGIE
jgi:hypothetical protein